MSSDKSETTADGVRFHRAGFAFSPESVGSVFDTLAAGHDDARRGGLANDVDRAVRMWIDLLARGARGRVADLGAGSGLDAKVFLDHGWEVDAVDVSSAMLDRARGHFGPHSRALFHRQDAQEFLAGCRVAFDVVIALGESLCYMPAPASVIQASADRLVHGGNFVASFLVAERVRTLLPEDVVDDDGVMLVVQERMDPPLRVRGISETWMRAVLEASGLDVVAWHADLGLRCALTARKVR